MHWFDAHPACANGGLVAIAWYEQGVRFLKVDSAGKIEEIGYWLPMAGQSSDVDWISERVVYVADYLRGSTSSSSPATSRRASRAGPRRQRRDRGRRVVRPPRHDAVHAAVRARDVPRRAPRESPTPARARLRIDGRRVATARGSALRRGLRARRLPRGRFSVQVEVRTRSGARTAGKRTYRRC